MPKQDPTCLLALFALLLLPAVPGASATACGDGIQAESEQCDDGNTVSGDGCSRNCECEQNDCTFSVSTSLQSLASVFAGLRPGATVTLSAGTYKGRCGFSIASANGTDQRPITIVGAHASATVIDCDNAGPVFEGIVMGTHLRILGIHFTNARRSDNGGGVLRAQGGSHVVIVDCRMSKCGTDQDGGALHVSNSSLVVNGSQFEENTAVGGGGAIALVDQGRAAVADSTFTLGDATDGGALYLARASTLTLERTLMSFNNANFMGGSVAAVTGCTVNVSSTILADNTAMAGSAICVRDGSLLGLVGDVSVVRNIATWAALFVWEGSTAEMQGNEGRIDFASNDALISSGAFLAYPPEDPTHVIVRKNVVFRDGWADTGRAGGWGLSGAVVELYDGVVVRDNSAASSGGIVLEAPGDILFATGRVIFENNHARDSDGGAITQISPAGSVYLSDVIVRNNSAVGSGGGYLEHINSGSSVSVMENISFTENVAFSGGGAQFFKSTVQLSRVLFKDNTAYQNGGGVTFQSGSTVMMTTCVFIENTALNGGAVAGGGKDALMHVTSTNFTNNRGLSEGGGMYLDATSALTLTYTEITACTASVGGGGISARGESLLSLMEGVAIRRCTALQGIGGGLLAAGGRLTIAGKSSLGHTFDNDASVVVEYNRARKGGGVGFMGSVAIRGTTTTQIKSNIATDSGGGLYGFSNSAKLHVDSGHRLVVQKNTASLDGGGLALGQGAQFHVFGEDCGPTCNTGSRGDGKCDLGCLSSGCNWDDGDCSFLFTDAGAQALIPCTCRPMNWANTGGRANEGCRWTDGKKGSESDTDCFGSSCDWHSYAPGCDPVKEELAKCPYFDATVYASLTAIPGLVYLKEGKGFTVPKFQAKDSRILSNLTQGSAGRCSNANCRTDIPPMSGVGDLEDGDTWCDSIVNWGGRVKQEFDIDLQEWCNPGWPAGVNAAASSVKPCVDLGKAWGVCSERPRLPTMGLEYDAESLDLLQLMSVPDVIAEHPGCGKSPLVFRENRAGRFGGALFAQACDEGLEQKQLCWLGGLSVKDSSSMILLFDGNEAGAAGGGFYTTCFSIGTWCRKALDKTIGLPSPFGSDGRVLSFVANQAGGYGQQMATAPSALVVGSSRQTYVPGKTFLNESLWILDATGQIIAGNPRRPINHMIQLLVVPVQAECTTFESCEQLKLQATDSFLSDGMAEMTSLLDYDILLQYCHLDSPDVNIMFFVSGSHFLDVTGADESDLTTLRRTLTISCSQCEPGWSRREMEIIDGQGTKQRVWTCSPCSRNQYVIDSNQHKCEQCPAGARCADGTFIPIPAHSVWEATPTGIYRIAKCPAGYVLIRDEAEPVLDRCVPCAPDTYSVEEAIFGERLWDLSVEKYNQYCHPCPRSRAMCSGVNDVRPLAGYWSPLSHSDAGTTSRRQGDVETAEIVQRGRSVTLYRCIPPTACLEGNASYPNGLCAPGGYGPLCGICNETDGYAKSKDGCRKCDVPGTQQSTTTIAVWTGLLGVPLFLTFWYFFALRPLVTRGPAEEEDERPEKRSEAWGSFKARIFFFAGRVSGHQIWRKAIAPVIGPAQALMSNCIAYVFRNNPKDYIKIIVSFYQVSTAFSSNIDVKWPDSVTSVWKFFAFLTMEIFKLYGYDCMFGEIKYLGRLALVTTVPMLVVFIFTVPWLASFFYQKHRRSHVFDTCANSVMWVIYLIYPLLCLMTIQGFKCVSVEDLQLLAADMNEPCPWNEGERGSWIFVWSVASMVLYPIGIPVILLACLLRLDLPRLSRYGKGEAIFQQMIGLYIRQRDESVCSRIATYVGGHKDASQPLVDLAERAAQLHREVSGNGEHAVTSGQFLNWLHQDVTDDDREEMEQIFAHFDEDGNGALDEDEMLALLTFLIDANSRIHVGLTLRTVKMMDVKTMTNHFLMDEGRERAQSSGLTRFFLKQLKQEAHVVPVQRRASLLESSSFKSQGSPSRLSSSSLADAEQVADADVTEKDEIIDSILDKGREMIRQGVFALPKLAWNANEANPEEKRVLQMIGFLLDAYHKEAWWWELFEMWRKFMLAGAIILIPSEGGKKIAFALLVSTICLYTSLRTSPYIVENLLKLHIMSLSAQCMTLFYALLLEIQDLSRVAEVCEDGKTCNQQNISDAIMESLLSLLQVSVFVLPVGLLLRDRGVFDAVGRSFKHTIWEARKGARVCTGHTAVKTKKVRWPSSVTHDDSASTSHLRSRKKSLNQPLETTFSSRKLMTARGATPQAARRLRTTDRSEPVHPVEDEITIHVQEIQEPWAAMRDGQTWGYKSNCGFTSRVFEDVAAHEKDCPVLQPFVAMGSGMDSGVSSVLHTLEDADAAGVDDRQTKNSKQKYNPTPRIPRFNLRASHQSSGEVAPDTLPILDSNQGMYSPRTPRGLSQPGPRVTEPTPRLSNGEKEPNSKDRQRVALDEKIQRSENSVDLSDARVRTTAIGQNTRGLDLNFSQLLSELQAQPEEEIKHACFRDFISRLREECLREEMESRKQEVTFLQRVHACAVAAASDEALVESSSLCRDGEASSVTATAFLHHAVSPGPQVNVTNDSSALVQSLGDAMCGNGCFGEDAQVTHWCRECDKAICSYCAQMHGRQPQTVSHALTEITSVVREREVLEEKLARVRETSMEQTRRITAEEEEIEREKQELAAQFKAEEESRQRELAQIQAAAEEMAHGRKAEEARRMCALEEESARLKANAEQEAERRKVKEDEILQQKQKLEEALARVQAHSFRSVLSFTPPRTEDSLAQEVIMTTISYTGVAAAAPSFASAPASGSPDWAIDSSPVGNAQAGQAARRATGSNSKQVSEQLEESLARLRSEENELVHQLEEARALEEDIRRNSAKRLLHSFLTEETIKTPFSDTGVAAASSASSTRPQRVQTPRQRVPTEKMERLGIEMSPDGLESQQGDEDGVRRKKTETERAAEVAVDTQTEQSIMASAQPTGAFTLPLETIRMPISDTRVAVPAASAAFAPVLRSPGTETPERAVDSSPARSAQAGARERLKAAKDLFNEGLIDESDFRKAKADIVSTLSRIFQ